TGRSAALRGRLRAPSRCVPEPYRLKSTWDSTHRRMKEGAQVIWVLWSIIIDYFSLFKTRVILRILIHLQFGSKVVLIAILVMDYIVYWLLFVIGRVLVVSFVIVLLYSGLESLSFVLGSVPGTVEDWVTLNGAFFPPFEVDAFVYFWAGFAPSL